MKIALIGYGGMGRCVCDQAKKRGHEVVAIVDPHADEAGFQTLSAEAVGDADVVIDCTLPGAAVDNLKVVAESRKNMVMVTTGWYQRMDEVRSIVEHAGIGFLWSSNFSIGVNLYFKMVEEAAKLIDKFEEYDIWGHEIHHFNKADSPSGTAKILEEILLKNIARKTSVIEEKLDRRRKDNEIHFSSVRGGAVNFEHVIGFDSEADTIKISHSARNRDGYALGAVKAAEWLEGKKGFYGMEDFLNFEN